jgi:hypothetical protein
MDKDVARELSKSDVSSLDLTGLTSIDTDVAQELAKFRGKLYIKSFSSIDQEAIRDDVNRAIQLAEAEARAN